MKENYVKKPLYILSQFVMHIRKVEYGIITEDQAIFIIKAWMDSELQINNSIGVSFIFRKSWGPISIIPID